jgi:hypothetical protein
MLLLQYLAEKLKARDNLQDFVDVYSKLIQKEMTEFKIDRQSLQDRASSVFDLLREKLYTALQTEAKKVLECIHESTGEVEDTIGSILSNPALLREFQSRNENGYDAIFFVPPRTLLRLVDCFPNFVFDGKVFDAAYTSINLSDEKATERSKKESKERIMSFLKDALRVISNSNFGQRNQKNELSRAALSIEFLLSELGQ